MFPALYLTLAQTDASFAEVRGGLTTWTRGKLQWYDFLLRRLDLRGLKLDWILVLVLLLNF